MFDDLTKILLFWILLWGSITLFFLDLFGLITINF